MSLGQGVQRPCIFSNLLVVLLGVLGRLGVLALGILALGVLALLVVLLRVLLSVLRRHVIWFFGLKYDVDNGATGGGRREGKKRAT